MEALVCKQCGGRINPKTLTCEYCGTVYRRNNTVMVIERPGAHVIAAETAIPREVIEKIPLNALSEIAMKRLMEEIAKGLTPFMSVETRDDYIHDIKHVRAKVRVLDPDVMF